MREWFKKTALRENLQRRILLLTTSLIVVLFTIAGPLISTAAAATEDAKASWQDDTLHYAGEDYTATTKPPVYKGSKSSYQHTVKTDDSDIAQVIYFNVADAKTATSATKVNYILSGSGAYTNPSGVLAITVVPPGQSDPATADPAASSGDTSCDSRYFGGLGWIICSVSQWIANGVDGVYNILKQFLEVDTVTQSDNGIFQIWNLVRTLANVCFIIVFLIIVYSHLTSIGISNYHIKEMVPRLIIAAILVNFSFWICQIFIDISNVLGYSVQAIFTNIEKSINLNVQINWSDITTYILSGGTVVAGTLGFAVTTGGSFASLGFILLGALISVGFSVLVAFIILAARQALIVVLVMIAPLAFVAMVLPSTKSLFEKWRKTLTTLLVFFPIFALLFGGAELAGAAIINSQYHNITTPGQSAASSGSLTIILIGLAVQVVPLAITPLIVQFSSGLLGRIAGMANDRKRGLVDRAKSWTQSNADDFRMRKLANAASRRDQQRRTENGLQRIGRSMRPSNIGVAFDRSKSNRDRRISRNQDFLAKRGEAMEAERINNPDMSSTATARNFYARQRQRMLDAHEYEGRTADHKGEIDSEAKLHMASLRQTDVQLGSMRRRTALNTGHAENIEASDKALDNLAVSAMIHNTPHLRAQAVQTKVDESEAAAYKASIDAQGDQTWKQREQNTGYLRIMRSEASRRSKHAADIEASMTATDQVEYDTLVNNSSDPHYQQIRRMKVQTISDQNLAKFQASEVESEGERAYRALFEDGTPGSRELRKQNVRIEQNKKESAAITNTLQKRADAHWEQVSLDNAYIQALRLKETQAEENATLTKNRMDQFIENVREDGGNAKGVFTTNASTANGINKAHEAAEDVEHATEKIKARAHSEAERRFIESEEGKRLNLESQAAEDTLEAIKAEEAARIQELRTEEGAKNLTGKEAEAAEELRKADYIKRAQNQRTANASTIANQEYAKQVLDDQNLPDSNEKITDVAGGIAGNAGVSQTRATAKQTVVKAFNDAVAAEKTLMSQIPEKDLLETLSNTDILDQPEEHIAALGGTIANRRHMGSHIKLWSQLGQLGSQVGKDLKAAEASGDTTRIENAKRHLSKIKSLQQQVMGDKSKTPFGVGDADQGKATVGEYEGNVYTSTRDRIMTHLSADSLSNMDPDDMRLIFEMARAGKLNAQEMEQVKKTYEAWQGDEILKSKIQDKHRTLLDPFVSGAFPEAGDFPANSRENAFWGYQFGDVTNDTLLPRR